VERTAGWLKGLRQIRFRYDYPGVVREAWNTRAAGVIPFRPYREAAAECGRSFVRASYDEAVV
jgi:hypothetical protein